MRQWILTLLMICTVYISKSALDADMKVYVSDFATEDTAHGLFKDCTPTNMRLAADHVVYITNFKLDADVIVYRREFLRDR